MDEASRNRLVEIESNRDAERRLDRINAIEKAADLLRSRFEGLLETLSREALTDEDIERIEQKWEKALNDAITNMHASFKAANEQQSKDMLGEVRGIFSGYREEAKDHQLRTQQEVIAAIQQRRGRWFWWALGIIATILGSVCSTLLIVWLIDRP